jgi:CRISPR-associated endonuclease Csn1
VGDVTKVLYGLGIDLGSGSVGWATLRLDKPVSGKPVEVLAMGVRRFDAGVSGDVQGGRDESNAVERRLKRGPRRQHWRRAWRIRKVFRTLIELRLLPEPSDSQVRLDSDARHSLILELDARLRTEFPAESDTAQHLLPYRIRRFALDGPISPFAFGRALYSLAQRRGFLSNRKAAGDDENEDGVVKRGIAELESSMNAAGARTLGEYFAGIDPEDVKLRRQWTARRMFRDEFDAIWSAQASHHPHLNEKSRKQIESAIFDQRPLKSQRGLVGRCELERYPIVDSKSRAPHRSGKMKYVGRRRALLACLPYQEFRLLQKVNDLKFVEPDGRQRSLVDPDCDELRTLLIDKLSAQGEMTFGAIRKLFGFKKSAKYGRNCVFNFEEGGDSKLVGNRTASKISGIIGPKWFSMSNDEQIRLVDEILQFESETALEERLRSAFGFDEAIAKKLSRVILEQGYGSISRRAIRKLLPLMREGVPFTTARHQLYPAADAAGEIFATLPPVLESMTDLRNPAVIRVLTELRKVVNTIVREMGRPPEWIRVELARELKHSRQKRQDIQKRN